jgi:hypothetical protein
VNQGKKERGRRGRFRNWAGLIIPRNPDGQCLMIPLTPERKAQLDDYAKRHGQDPASALDDALVAYLEWERQDYQEAVEGIRRGH